MNGKKIGLFLTTLVLIAILAGCSADALVKNSQAMESMKNAGMGTAGEAVVDQAVSEVNSFISGSEECMKWPEQVITEDGKGEMNILKTEESDGFAGEENYIAVVRAAVSAINKAAETGTSDSRLREALSAPYPETGKTHEGQVFRKFGDALDNSAGFTGALDAIPFLLPDPEKGMEVVDSIKNYEVPIPIQCFDIIPILMKAMSRLDKIIDIVEYKPENPPAEKPKFDASQLEALPGQIAANTGERTYQTVGDKISVGILYDIVDAADKSLGRFNEANTGEDSKVNYGNFSFDWVLKNCSDQIDRIVSDLNAIAYINGIHIDAAGIIGSYVSKI